MAWFPMFVDLKDRRCLVAGGGRMALHKACLLRVGGGRVKVIAPEILPELVAMQVDMCARDVRKEDVDHADLVVDATGDLATGVMLAQACSVKGVPINVVDQPSLCSFIFPAILRRGSLIAAVSSGGSSPVAAAWARDQLDEALPPWFETVLEQMERLRPLARERLSTQEERSRFLHKCFAEAAVKGAALSDAELQRIWAEVL